MRAEMLQRFNRLHDAVGSHLIRPIERAATRRREPNTTHHRQVELPSALCSLDIEQLGGLDHHRQGNRGFDLRRREIHARLDVGLNYLHCLRIDVAT